MVIADNVQGILGDLRRNRGVAFHYSSHNKYD